MHESIGWAQWYADRFFLFVPGQFAVRKFLETFQEYPPRQEIGSFTIDKVLAKIAENRPS